MKFEKYIKERIDLIKVSIQVTETVTYIQKVDMAPDDYEELKNSIGEKIDSKNEKYWTLEQYIKRGNPEYTNEEFTNLKIKKVQ